MAYAVLVRFDSAGAWPVIVSADDRLESSDGTCWRFVAAVQTFHEAVRLHRQLQACRDRGELFRASQALGSEGSAVGDHPRRSLEEVNPARSEAPSNLRPGRVPALVERRPSPPRAIAVPERALLKTINLWGCCLVA